MSSPARRQSARSCSDCRSSSPFRRSGPRSTCSTCSSSGSLRSGRLKGSLGASSVPGGKTSSMLSAASSSMHRVIRNRHAADQSSRGCFTTTLLSAWLQRSCSACQRPPRRPWKPSTCTPGACASNQRLPPVVPSNVPTTPPIRSSNANSADRLQPSIFTGRLKARAPWRNADARHRHHPAGEQGRAGSAPPATPSARPRPRCS